MKEIKDIVNDIRKIKEKKDSGRLIDYILQIEGKYFPSSIMLDKARAIQLSEGDGYSLDDAKNIIELILEIEPDYIPAYIEMGYFYDMALDDPDSAVAILNNGIKKTQDLLEELCLCKAQVISCMKKWQGDIAKGNGVR